MEFCPISVHIGWRRLHLNSSWIEFKLIRINSSPTPTFHQIVPNFHFHPSSKVQTDHGLDHGPNFEIPIPIYHESSMFSIVYKLLFFYIFFYFIPFREHFFSFCGFWFVYSFFYLVFYFRRFGTLAMVFLNPNRYQI